MLLLSEPIIFYTGACIFNILNHFKDIIPQYQYTCVGTVTKSPFIGLHSTIYTNKDAVIALIDLVSHENSWVQVKDKVRVNT